MRMKKGCSAKLSGQAPAAVLGGGLRVQSCAEACTELVEVTAQEAPQEKITETFALYP